MVDVSGGRMSTKEHKLDGSWANEMLFIGRFVSLETVATAELKTIGIFYSM